MLNHRLKDSETGGFPQNTLRCALGMRHESGNIPPLIADSGNIGNGTIGIARFVGHAGGIDIPPENLAMGFNVRQTCRIDVITSIPMGHRNSHPLPIRNGTGERSAPGHRLQQHMLTHKFEIAIAHERARQQSGFSQYLESIAYPQNQSTSIRKFFDG